MRERENGAAVWNTHLGHGGVDLQDLLVTFDLSHDDLAAELCGGAAASLQGEGTVQRLLVAAPHLGEGELLMGGAKVTNSVWTRPPDPNQVSHMFLQH